MGDSQTAKTYNWGLLNDRVLSFLASQQMGVIRMTDLGAEYYGKLETHDYQLYLAVNGIEHTKSRARHPQNQRHLSLEELQGELDIWLEYYNTERSHQGKMCCGRTPADPA